MHYTGRGRLENPWISSPKDIAERLEEWCSEQAGDGFVVGPTYLPGTFEGFVRLVIPEIRQRGVSIQARDGECRPGGERGDDKGSPAVTS
jgi:alkanesulfonate monooxygenase SsuD/methylene tetrahydromethanopterin reductase-like flavin-dependent oxidoreductase (luciferase family)